MCNDPLFSLQDKFWPEKMTSKLVIFFWLIKNQTFFNRHIPNKTYFFVFLGPHRCSRTHYFCPRRKKIFDGDYGIGPFRPSVRACVRLSVRPSESFLDSNQTYFFEFLIVYRCSRTRYFRHSTNFDPF